MNKKLAVYTVFFIHTFIIYGLEGALPIPLFKKSLLSVSSPYNGKHFTLAAFLGAALGGSLTAHCIKDWKYIFAGAVLGLYGGIRVFNSVEREIVDRNNLLAVILPSDSSCSDRFRILEGDGNYLAMADFNYCDVKVTGTPFRILDSHSTNKPPKYFTLSDGWLEDPSSAGRSV